MSAMKFETAEAMAKRAEKSDPKLLTEADLMLGQQSVIDVLRIRVREKLRAQDIAETMRVTEKDPVIDLRREPELEQMLKENRWIKIDLDDEGERLYSYLPKHENVVDRASLVARIEAQMNGGIPVSELEDSYEGAEEDIEECIVSGQVIAVQHATEHSVSLYPRGENYLVQLEAKVAPVSFEEDQVEENDPLEISIQTTQSCVDDLRRGDAIRVGKKQWYRVSSRVNKSRHQPKRAERPLSVSSTSKMHSANVYCDPYDASRLPLQAAPKFKEEDYIHNFTPQASLTRHGVSNDIRTLWLDTAAAVPTDRYDLQSRLAEIKKKRSSSSLTSSESNAAAHKKRPHESRWLGAAAAAAAREAKATAEPKKRRMNTRFLRLTNTHLIGTEIGDALARSNDRTKHLAQPASNPSTDLQPAKKKRKQ